MTLLRLLLRIILVDGWVWRIRIDVGGVGTFVIGLEGAVLEQGGRVRVFGGRASVHGRPAAVWDTRNVGGPAEDDEEAVAVRVRASSAASHPSRQGHTTHTRHSFVSA